MWRNSIFCILFAFLAPLAVFGEVVWEENGDSLTREDMLHYIRTEYPFTPYDKELERKLVLARGSDELFDFYAQLVISCRDNYYLADQGLIHMNGPRERYLKYEKEFRRVFDDARVKGNLMTHQFYLNLLYHIGNEEDGPIVVALLEKILTQDMGWGAHDARRRLIALAVTLGGEQTLRDLEAMLPRLEERHKADLEKQMSPQYREFLLDAAEGSIPEEQIDQALVEGCEALKRDHQKLLAKVEKLREKVRLEKEGGASTALQQPNPEEGGAAVPSSPTDSPTIGGDTDPAGSGEEGRNAARWASAILLVLIFSGYAIHRKRSRG